MVRRVTTTLLTVLIMLSVTGVLRAEPATDALKKENAALRDRVTKLEAAMKALQDQMRGAAGAQAVVAGQRAVTSGIGVEFYGLVKLDAAYDTARMNTGNFGDFVASEETNKDDNEFNMNARHSRFGLNFSGPEVGSAASSGKVEIDFYGGGEEFKAVPMMRHAYMQLDLDSGLSILAGQTSDVISPLVPSTLNYWVGWYAGNIGYRRPQIRVTKGFELASDVDLNVRAAATRTIGGSAVAPGTDPGDTGEDAGFPTLQGRAGISFPFIDGKTTTLGVSGHWGQEEYDQDATGAHRSVDTWSVNLDLTLPLTDVLTLKGEAYVGANLKTYRGGINQGVTGLREISSAGGWVAASVGPIESWRFNLGGTLEDVDEGDVISTRPILNSSIFVNAIYSFNEKASVGFELTRWETDYKGTADGDCLRLQTSFMYKF